MRKKRFQSPVLKPPPYIWRDYDRYTKTINGNQKKKKPRNKLQEKNGQSQYNILERKSGKDRHSGSNHCHCSLPFLSFFCPLNSLCPLFYKLFLQGIQEGIFELVITTSRGVFPSQLCYPLGSLQIYNYVL